MTVQACPSATRVGRQAQYPGTAVARLKGHQPGVSPGQYTGMDQAPPLALHTLTQAVILLHFPCSVAMVRASPASRKTREEAGSCPSRVARWGHSVSRLPLHSHCQRPPRPIPVALGSFLRSHQGRVQAQRPELEITRCPSGSKACSHGVPWDARCRKWVCWKRLRLLGTKCLGVLCCRRPHPLKVPSTHHQGQVLSCQEM